MDCKAIAVASRAASLHLAASSLAERNGVLESLCTVLRARLPEVVAANALDVAAAEAGGLDASVLKRLHLDEPKVRGLLDGLQALIALPDPLGRSTLSRTLAEGLELTRLSCPLGVLAIIFEARPEAVIQIASLAIKSGNAVILKGGKEAAHSNAVLVEVVRAALASTPCANTPPDAVQLVSTREDVAELLQLEELIDLVIPRGSLRLVREVKAATRIPVLGHADGICHVYLDPSADPAMAAPLVVDSKTHYPAACNAAETLLVHQGAVAHALPLVAQRLLEAGVTLHVDQHCKPTALAALQAATAAAAAAPQQQQQQQQQLGGVVDAAASDWDTEWLSLHMGVAAVGSCAEAVAWINRHGSGHTDAIIGSDGQAVDYFLRRVDSAGVYHNASTRFADGYRYGFGAEVGISTGKLHARGPVGLDGLCTYKYLLEGEGHTVASFSGQAARQWLHKDH
jgi:glutamate-5-semialdehyde dehydrogenase